MKILTVEGRTERVGGYQGGWEREGRIAAKSASPCQYACDT